MISDEDDVNLHPIERILRVGLGALLLWFGTEVNIIAALFQSSYYRQGTFKYIFASVVSIHPDFYRVIGWTLGFILIFTGANGFCPFYKVFHINTNKPKSPKL